MNQSLRQLSKWAEVAQGAYAFFTSPGAALAALTQASRADFTEIEAKRFLGLLPNGLVSTTDGVDLRHHAPDAPNGFSASVFFDRSSSRNVLSIRGTFGLVDIAEDLNRIGVQGFAGDQAVALYRYYRKLTTAPGQSVNYSDSEVALLSAMRMGMLVNANAAVRIFGRSKLRAELAADVGSTPLNGSSASVLQPGAPLIVTGHSLGGHLALLFGRLFPNVTEHVYTYNAPGIGLQGELALRLLGIAPIQPARVTNVASAMGNEAISRIWSKPGENIGVATEPGNLLYQHSIVPLTDTLALYGAFATLSPGLGDPSVVSGIISAASPYSEESLEAVLDALRGPVGVEGAPTLVARTLADLGARDKYYENLYAVLDARDPGHDYRIESLVDKSAGELAAMAGSEVSVRFALHELAPFAAGGADYSEFEDSFSGQWLASRAEWLAAMLEGNLVDRVFGFSGTADSVLLRDVDSEQRYSQLDGAQGNLAVPISSLADRGPIQQFLSDATYNRTVVFGSDSPGAGDQLLGLSGGDRLFGAEGDDSLDGAGGDDYLEGGAGADRLIGGAGDDTLDGGEGVDRLEGGAGHDTYRLPGTLEADTIADREGAVYAGAIHLTGGIRNDSGDFFSSDGNFSYNFSGDLAQGGTLTVNGSLRVEDFRNGDLGIHLDEYATHPSVSPPATGTIFLGDYAYLPRPTAADQTNAPFYDSYGNPLPTARIAATPGSSEPQNLFFGTPGNDEYLLGGGDDFAEDSHGGDDHIDLGTGADSGWGGDGDDLVEGGEGRDYLEGGSGNDTLIALRLQTALQDVEDTDAIDAAGIWGDRISGGEGDDVIYGDPGNNTILGGPGSDRIWAGAGGDSIGAPYSDDEGGADYVDAGAGNDVVFSGDGDDVIFGGKGDDGVFDTGGADIVYAGEGDDSIVIEASGDGAFDYVDAGPGNDHIGVHFGRGLFVGGAGNDFLESFGGYADLFGGEGDDTLTTQGGGGLLDGGPGNDVLGVVNAGGGHANVRWGRGYGSDVGAFGFGSVTIDAVDVLPGELSVSYVQIAFAQVTLPGIEFRLQGTGDVLSVLDPAAFPDASELSIEFADGTVWDQEYIDSLLAADQETGSLSEIAGTESSELLFGSAASDVFSGNGGNDRLIGGTGNDVYRYAPGNGFDVIEDSDSTPGNTDSLIFAGGIEAQGVEVLASGDDYILALDEGGVRLLGGRTADGAIERIEFADGTVWTAADVEARAAVLPDNRAPQMAESLGRIQVDPGTPVSFSLPQGSIEDADRFDSLQYYAITADGERLPDWLEFDAATLTIAGTPSAQEAGTHELLLIAVDQSGEAALSTLTVVVGAGEAPAVEVFEPVASALVEVAMGTDTPPAPSVPESAPIPLAVSKDSSFSVSEPDSDRVGVPLDPLFRDMQQRFDVLLQVGRTNLTERYADAIREFEERRIEREEPPPPPSEEEIAAWNSAMHAWHERNPGFAETDLGGNDGIWTVGWGLPGPGDRSRDGATGVGAIPGLGNPNALSRLTGADSAPALTEGLRNLR